MLKIRVFLPCRKGSERIPAKNILPFAGVNGGLTRIKLEQLIRCPEISEICVSTNDPVVVDIAKAIETRVSVPIRVDQRPEALCAATTSTDELVDYVPQVFSALEDDVVILWTHVTSPFFASDDYRAVINAYRRYVVDGPHDSVMSVNRLQEFIWSDNGPVNYDRSKEKWPRTQTLPPWWKVNSAVFMARLGVYRQLKDRVGRKPFLFESSPVTGIDIDWKEDFEYAQLVWSRWQQGSR